MQKTVIGGVEAITLIRPEAQKTAIILHGFGANYEDLAPLAPYLDTRRQWNWIFPNGIIEVPLGPYMSGRAWFPIRMAEVEAAAMRGEVIDFADAVPEGFESASARLCELLGQLRLSPNKLVVGGFSQGAMMVVDVAANLSENVAGLLLFSGSLINQKSWKKRLPAKADVPFFQSHGQSDPILGFAHAKRLHQMLTGSGLKGEFVDFVGGHEIPPPVLERAAKFLTSLRSS